MNSMKMYVKPCLCAAVIQFNVTFQSLQRFVPHANHMQLVTACRQLDVLSAEKTYTEVTNMAQLAAIY